MTTVQEAIELVKNNLVKGSIVRIPLSDSLGFFLAEDIYAPMNIPSFNQSAMDGYAFQFESISAELEIVDEIPAGDIRAISINPGEAVRIFTGAKVPDNCDTVVMQELTERDGNLLVVKDERLHLGGNIRKEGHQIKQGELALAKDSEIVPATIGFLASIGLTHVPVYQKPRVAILATGDELVKPGNPIQRGQVYESNAIMLRAALCSIGIEPKIISLPDDFDKTKNAIHEALNQSDIVILTGGISVGDYDFVRPALEANNVRPLFYKVKQKPGKPLFFGKKENTLVFALPGNPAAVLNCFYIYVLMAINRFTGNPKLELERKKGYIQSDYTKKSGRAEFMKAFINNDKVELLEGQGSDVLLSFAKANCLVFLPNEKETLVKGEQVDIFRLPL